MKNLRYPHVSKDLFVCVFILFLKYHYPGEQAKHRYYFCYHEYFSAYNHSSLSLFILRIGALLLFYPPPSPFIVHDQFDDKEEDYVSEDHIQEGGKCRKHRVQVGFIVERIQGLMITRLHHVDLHCEHTKPAC